MGSTKGQAEVQEDHAREIAAMHSLVILRADKTTCESDGYLLTVVAELKLFALFVQKKPFGIGVGGDGGESPWLPHFIV